MTPNEHEQQAAKSCKMLADVHAAYYAPKDAGAAAIAILIAALELATPDLSPAMRAFLFNPED